MRRMIFGAALAAAVLLVMTPAYAQLTTGNINGRVLDEQGAAVPGANVTAKNSQTGFVRTAVSDEVGLYRLNALPIGIYDVVAELQGFSGVDKKAIVVNVGQTIDVNFEMRVAQLTETITVTGSSPLIETSQSSVGGVVDIGRVENLPLNGRQFANLAATVPGVGLGFHSDPTKSTQYSPQIAGGNGRNVNYQIDGGDNNDDTVGGLLQLFPLEAIQEFNFITQRYKAEYGRSNGGVMNIVTKSGTNNFAGSWITFFRDKGLNSRTFSEKASDIDKQDYRRWQYGGSFGGPIVQNKAHFFGAYERTQQDTFQAVNTKGLFPNLDGVYPTPYRENIGTGKVTANVTPAQYLSVRYGRNTNNQPYGASATSTPDNWGESTNNFNSFNLNHNWVLGGSKLNEFIFQYADFRNHISAASNNPNQSFPNGITVGQNGNTPQTTEQKKWQFRDDFSWHMSGMGGLGHDFKAGVNFINEPRLFITFNTGKDVVFSTHSTNDINGPISTVSLSSGESSANIPTKQFSTYLQDDWRINDRLTLNIGVRYDLFTGMQFDQSKNPNYVAVQNAGRNGRWANVIGMENFGLDPEEDKNNIQPRIGGAWDIRGDGRDVIRAGWGIYQDFGYTNSNGLFAAADATGSGFGPIFTATAPNGLVRADGQLYRVGDPLPTIAHLNEASGGFPLFGQFVDPRLEQPYSRQTSVGWSHQLGASTVASVDYVRSDGRDLNTRPRLNTRPNGGPFRFADITLQPQAATTRPAVSRGKSRYDGLILGVRRRMSNGIDFNGSYTLSRARSNIGTASDELNSANIIDATNPFDPPVQFGPTSRTDARHRVSLSAVIQLPWGFQVAPFFTFRSALPVATTRGLDLNRDFQNNEIPIKAFQFTDVGEAPKEIGDCETVNCGRGAKFSQMNLRVSKSFRLTGRVRLEGIAEVFNLFDATNPTAFTTRQTLGSIANPSANPVFMQPTAFAGDFHQTEQRVGQLGFRVTF